MTPYNEWETPQLQSYLQSRGNEVEESVATDRDALVAQVKESWTDTTDSASNAYGSVRDWVFDRSVHLRLSVTLLTSRHQLDRVAT